MISCRANRPGSWVVLYDDRYLIGSIEQFGPRAYLIAAQPSRRFWSVQTTYRAAVRWCAENAEDVMDGGILDQETSDDDVWS